MYRIPCAEREGWRELAAEYGFHFYAMHGEPYWDERAYYQFSLRQIERDLEDPSAELHQLCLAAVERVVEDEQLLARFRIPPAHWELVRDSWRRREPSLYSRLDLVYDGTGPARLYENNADTPTSVYESGFWQWLWLEDKVRDGSLGRNADQFNSLQEKLVARFAELGSVGAAPLYLSCCRDSDEDRGTVQYLEDCAAEAGLDTRFLYIEDLGEGAGGAFTDLDDRVIDWLFKLYPWEFMFREDYARLLGASGVRWLEPPWKAVLSNKALLALLWQMQYSPSFRHR